jgi:hypothetical protein
MATILIKRPGFWTGLAKIAGGVGLLVVGHIDAGIAVIIGGVSSMIHSGEANQPADNTAAPVN